jgi:heme oxygenase (biliverdin-IX-beta and delta-forming)
VAKNGKANSGIWLDLSIDLPIDFVIDFSVIEATISPAILSRLRVETRQEHTALEDVLDLMHPGLTSASYCHRLQIFYGFYAPFEVALKARLQDIRFSDELANRLHKALLLKNDLAHFGVATENLPICRKLPSFNVPSNILGAMYVVEGATLGGRLITKHIQKTLNIPAEGGGTFFQGYGDATATRWQGMRQLLVNGADDVETENAIVASAIETFKALRDWSKACLDQNILTIK